MTGGDAFETNEIIYGEQDARCAQSKQRRIGGVSANVLLSTDMRRNSLKLVIGSLCKSKRRSAWIVEGVNQAETKRDHNTEHDS